LAAGVLRPPTPCAKERTGIIAVNDHTAYGVLRAATEAGLTPGRDFGLIGFDDAPHSRVVGLTSVRPPLDALGEEAGHLAARALAGDASALQVGLRSLLVPRASTCLPAAGAKRRARREA
jgi:LacI family transcriptional regulator